MAFDTTVDEIVEIAPESTEATTDDEAQAEPQEVDDVEQDEQTQGDDAAEGDEEDAPETEPEPEKKGGRAADRIKQLVAEKKELEAKYAQLNEQSQQPKQTASNDGAPVKPNIEDFDLDSEGGLDSYFAAQAEYDEKHQDWKLDQRLQQREQAKQQQQRDAEITQTFNARFKANPEFKENFQQLAELMQDKPIQADPSELYSGDDLMDLLEHVAADHDLYYELADMSPSKQYAEFGRIHATIQARKGGQSKAVRQSKAPPPPNHTNANAPIKKNPYSQSDDDFMRSRGL